MGRRERTGADGPWSLHRGLSGVGALLAGGDVAAGPCVWVRRAVHRIVRKVVLDVGELDGAGQPTLGTPGVRDAQRVNLERFRRPAG